VSEAAVAQEVRGTSSSGGDQTTGQLVSRLSGEISALISQELRLAQLELSGKAKEAGLGAGMLGVAGILALYGVGALVAAAVLALALLLPAWLAAVVVAVFLLTVAATAGLLGKKRVVQATPPVPEQAMDNLKRDVEAVRRSRAH
jgi:uncharacterized membrane protein YqjE